MKTTSYTSSCSSFNQFVNSGNMMGNTGGGHGGYNCFYGQGGNTGHDG